VAAGLGGLIPAEAQPYDQESRELERRTILIECVRLGLRVTLIALRVTVSIVIFQKPVLGATIFAGNLSNAPPW
jgi:hypothetical protein